VGRELRDLAVIEEGAMVVRDGVIERVGPQAEIEPLLGADWEVIDAAGGICLPGFVDAHTHPVFGGNRVDEYEMRAQGVSYQEIAARGGGIKSTVAKTRAAEHAELYQAGFRYAEWFLRGGTTTIEAKSGYGLTVDDELKILRVIGELNQDTGLQYVPTFLGAHDIPADYRDRREAYVSMVIDEMLPLVAEHGLAEYCDIFCEDKVFSLEESRRVLRAAQEHGFKIRMHADQLTLGGGAKLAAELGAATADHLEHTDSDGIAALVAAGVQPVLLPGSVYALGSSRYPAAREMIDAGLAVVLATDFNPGSSPTPSMAMILSLASTHMKMTPAEGVIAATINAAYSLGRGDRIGSLEPGKQADFVIHGCADYREISYFFGVSQVRAVYVGGQLVA
jgi:imidazolonepropionase